ncbi:MAG: HDOD domain-containing protein [Burkholderiaceae bacterium]|jgi:HD-like signal output (HDOD) protein|nr:HDOD domain-containing protein [Burkholderiaceae bacterium]MCZ8176473.1 HDOD domain-containing protein [Burkholderiaceae bacterium]
MSDLLEPQPVAQPATPPTAPTAAPRGDAEEREEAARRQRRLKLLQSIDKQPEFASLQAQMSQLQRVARDDNAHARALTALIDDNPALLSKLLRLINAAYYSPVGGGSITSMHRAVSLMGFHSIGLLAGSLLMFDRLPKGADGDRLRREFARAQLAAALAQELCHSPRHADHIYVATLFQRLGDLLAGIHFAPDMQVLDDLLDAQELPRGSAERLRQRDVLARRTWGLTLEDLGQEIAERWGWPPRMLKIMRSLGCDNPGRSLRDDEYARVLNTACNELAERLMAVPAEGESADREAARRDTLLGWSRDLQVPLGLDAASLPAQVERTLAGWRDLLGGLGVPPDALRSDAGQAPPPKKNPLDPKSLAYRQALAENLSDAVDHLARMNKKAAPPEQVMESALGWMMKTLDLQRAILCLRDDARPLLVPRLAQGHKGVVLSRHFEIPVEPPGDLFGLLCAKQADVLISDTADPLIDQRLPVWYRQKVAAGSFVLLPVHHDGRVVGMLYGDQHEAHAMHLNDRALTLLKLLRNQLLEALKRLLPALSEPPARPRCDA